MKSFNSCNFPINNLKMQSVAISRQSLYISIDKERIIFSIKCLYKLLHTEKLTKAKA